ncbi:hypothetical protein [uncultured Actinomyces sp.]|uniref:hypothetical protein n=1 Tax=uncultured Actinomyces sp. TaxID=249061 RepID=UPI0028D38440|nr:hypothetical protein [uncultured Actinomyces sp.]
MRSRLTAATRLRLAGGGAGDIVPSGLTLSHRPVSTWTSMARPIARASSTRSRARSVTPT